MPIPTWARSIARQAWPYAIAGIILGELTIPLWLYPPLPAELHVNPFARRDWDRYVERTAVRHDPELRILLLSNSQGRGPEYAPQTVYSTLLERELNRGRTGPPVRVVNWSFGPNRVPEAIVLLARARDLAPHLLLAVFSPIQFQEADYVYQGRPTPLSMFPGDITDTAWLYRSRLPAGFREHYLGPPEAARAYLARYLPTFRIRDLPLSALHERLPWLGSFMLEAEKGSWFATGGAARAPLTRRPVVEDAAIRPNPALVRMFDEAARNLGAKRVFVFQPHGFFAPNAARAAVPLQEQLLQDGWEVWDMMDAVPWREFLEGPNAHLTDQGHADFARALAARVRPLLDGRP